MSIQADSAKAKSPEKAFPPAHAVCEAMRGSIRVPVW